MIASAIQTLGGVYYKVSTPKGVVHVWRPKDYDGGDVVAYLHGYRTNNDSAMADHKLIQQFAAAGTKAWYMIPGAPSSNEQGVVWKSLDELLAIVGSDVGKSFTSVHAVAHSGGYRTVLDWLKSQHLHRVTLLDALYAGTTTFASWAAQAGHKLVTVAVGGDPLKNSIFLAGRPGVSFVREATTHMGLVESGKFLATYIAMGAPSLGNPAVLALLGILGLGVYFVLR